jgi:soluble lytic murein transglycosylase-like protein
VANKLGCLALVIPLGCAARGDAQTRNRRPRLNAPVVARAFAVPAAPPSQVGAARHSPLKSQPIPETPAADTVPIEAAPEDVAQSQALAPAVGSTVYDADVEVLRIEKNLELMDHDPAAREAFYRQIDQMVARVRSGKLISSSLLTPGPPVNADSLVTKRPIAASEPGSSREKPRVPGVWHHFTAPVGTFSLARAESVNPPNSKSQPAPAASLASYESPALPPVSVTIPESSSALARRGSVNPQLPTDIAPIQSPSGDGVLDPSVVARLLYWARQNHCPPELALATAWQESHLSLESADGSSGEIGMMQILPARAKAEGVNPRSLRNPDVDMWLGTKLLAEYYQQEGSVSRAAMKYVAGPNVFNHQYPMAVREYIAWYSNSVKDYSQYFKSYVNF